MTKKFKFVFKKNRKHCGKRRKCWLPAFSPFSTMFSKALFFRGVKSRDCVVKSQIKSLCNFHLKTSEYIITYVHVVANCFCWYLIYTNVDDIYDSSTIISEQKMYGWEKLSGLCGMGCKMFFSPWGQDEKSYDEVNKEEFDLTDDPAVTSEPKKPLWTEMQIVAPIVKKKSNSLGNLKMGPAYEKVSVAESMPRLDEKRASTPNLTKNGSRASLTGSKQVLHVTEIVTTV